MVLSPDGVILASKTEGGVVLWDAAEGKRLHTLDSPGSGGMNWSPDGRMLATAFASTATLWDASSGQLISTLEGHTSRVCALAWSSDGRTLATGSEDATVALWDIAHAHTTPLYRQVRSTVTCSCSQGLVMHEALWDAAICPLDICPSCLLAASVVCHATRFWWAAVMPHGPATVQ